jgi:hypothetical protein
MPLDSSLGSAATPLAEMCQVVRRRRGQLSVRVVVEPGAGCADQRLLLQLESQNGTNVVCVATHARIGTELFGGPPDPSHSE